MSNLSEQTEEKAIAVLAKCVLLFEKLHYMDMTAQDAFDARSAENLLKGIIDSNGYTVSYRPGRNGKPYRRCRD